MGTFFNNCYNHMVFILFSLQCLISVNDFDCLYKLKDYFTFDYIAASGLKLQNLYIHPFFAGTIFLSVIQYFSIFMIDP